MDMISLSNDSHEPPPVIHSARTLWYAVNDESVEFTDKIDLFVGQVGNLERLQEMPLLAICEDYGNPENILLFFCNQEWEPQGTIVLKSVEEAKIKAEKGYKGVSWVHAEAPEDELNKYLLEVYKVDPATEWWRIECAFCGKESSEVDEMLAGEKAYICDGCVRTLYGILNEEKFV